MPENNYVAALGASIVRTVVPLIVGLIATSAAKLGLDVRLGGALDEVVITVITTIYYALVRLAETHVAPAWGWLLGYAKAPKYPVAPPAPPGD